MRNILLLCESYGGGVKTYIDTIYSNKHKFLDCKIGVLISSERLDNTYNLDKHYIVEDHLSFGKSLLKIIKAIKKIHREVKSNHIDIIHANSTISGLLIYFYSFINHEVAFIYTPHGYYSLKNMSRFKKKLIRIAEKKINKICKKVIHVSESEEKEAMKFQMVPLENSVVVFNGVKDPQASINKKEFNHRLFTIVNLARVDDQKNPIEFIKIAKYLIDHNLNVQFIWAGSGSNLNEARKKVEEYKLENRVRFIGFSDKKEEFLKQADLYFSTSHYEGLPFAAVEAMSYGLPLLLSNVVGHEDLIIEGNNGKLFDHGDYEAIKRFINTLLNNKDIYVNLANNSYLYYKVNFSEEKMLKELQVIYHNC